MSTKQPGRGSEKLAFALDFLQVDVAGKICADLGCNVGGFTACLLARGAAKVYAVDTGYGILDWNLRNDARVAGMERTNALHVALPDPVDVVTVDLAWTRQERSLPKALGLLKPGGVVVSLLKPNYEAERDELHRGVVTSERVEAVKERVLEKLRCLGIEPSAVIASTMKGGKGGNAEFFLLVKKEK